MTSFVPKQLRCRCQTALHGQKTHMRQHQTPTDANELTLVLFSANRGSKFLKEWMTFLEDNADLRYPDFTSLTTDA